MTKYNSEIESMKTQLQSGSVYDKSDIIYVSLQQLAWITWLKLWVQHEGSASAYYEAVVIGDEFGGLQGAM